MDLHAFFRFMLQASSWLLLPGVGIVCGIGGFFAGRYFSKWDS